MERQIHKEKTIEAVRQRYGSVRDFCRDAGIDFPYFYMIVSGRRGRGGKDKRGPAPTRALEVLERLEREDLIVFCDAA